MLSICQHITHQLQPNYSVSWDVYVTQQAVKSTLAAVYMSMAGYPLNKGQEYYAKAAEKAKEVIDGVNSGKYNAIYGCRLVNRLFVW